MASLWTRVEGLVGVKAARYTLVSGISVLATQVILLAALEVLGWSATVSNVTAVSLAAIPSYVLNRAWTWGKRGRNHLFKEVLPFWGMALLGLLMSTLLVGYAAEQWGGTLVVMLTNLFSFGLLWVGKFFVLHFVLFKSEDGPSPAEALPEAPINV